MRRHTLLTLISLALGTSTIWLAIELRAVRQELAELRAMRPVTPASAAVFVPPTDMANSAIDTKPVAMSSAPSQPALPRDATRAQGDAAMHAATLANNVWVRSWLNDPKKRAKILADNREASERDVPRELLGLADDDYDRLLDILAASGMRYAEAMYRCNTDPGCDLEGVIRTQLQVNRRELVGLLGEEKAQRLENYRDNGMERNAVASLRSALPDSMSLNDAQAEKLADAFGEERRRMVKVWQERGEDIGAIANYWGALHFPGTKDVTVRIAEATEFQRRQRDRAAEILTPAQLEQFTTRQEQMLEIARGAWEYEEQAARSQ